MSVFLEGPSALKNMKSIQCTTMTLKTAVRTCCEENWCREKQRKINIKHLRDIAASKTSARNKGTWNSEKQTQRKGPFSLRSYWIVEQPQICIIMLLEIVGLLLPFLVISEFMVMADTFYIFIEFAWCISTYPLLSTILFVGFRWFRSFLLAALSPERCRSVALLNPLRRARFCSAVSMSSPKPRREQNLWSHCDSPEGTVAPLKWCVYQCLPKMKKCKQCGTVRYDNVQHVQQSARLCMTFTTKKPHCIDQENQTWAV